MSDAEMQVVRERRVMGEAFGEWFRGNGSAEWGERGTGTEIAATSSPDVKKS